MKRALAWGAVYGAALFALGFVLGTVRVLAITPATGPLVATSIELPVMLFAAWSLCNWLLTKENIAGDWISRAAMACAFIIVLGLGELGVALLIFGRSWAGQVAEWQSVPGTIGLIGQSLAALMPLLAARPRVTPPPAVPPPPQGPR